MRFAQLFTCCVILVCLHEGTALKCRTGEHQTNDQFQKVMKRCRNRIIQGDRKMANGNSSDDDNDSNDDDDDSYDNDDDEPQSDEEFVKKLSNRTRTTDRNMMNNPGANNNGDQKTNSRRYEQNSDSGRPYPYNRIMGNASSGATGGNMKDRNSQNITTLRNGGSNNVANSGYNTMQTNQHDQACVVQCFFDELNLIDKNGFPEKSAVTKVMMQNIRDPELQDFVEEAVLDCFYMIEGDKNKEQCKFSQNLLNCLAIKGRERCEDWDYQQ